MIQTIKTQIMGGPLTATAEIKSVKAKVPAISTQTLKSNDLLLSVCAQSSTDFAL
jgi:hypothetical protein